MVNHRKSKPNDQWWRLETTTLSEDSQYNVLTAQANIPENGSVIMKAERTETPADGIKENSRE